MPMGIVLGDNQYGKAEVRLVHVDRSSPRHVLTDLNVTTQLRGDFTGTHLHGDNTDVLTTDAQKNTVYALAREHGVRSPESFALLLGRHFTGLLPSIHGARVSVESFAWERIPVGGVPHDHAFSRPGGERRTAAVTVEGERAWVLAGLTDLVVLKSSGSEFTGFARDRFTTLPETTDRILATSVTARWRYRSEVPYDETFTAVRTVLLETFATLHSLALQQTLFAMGHAVLEAFGEIAEIRLSMPNKHHYLADLSPFGLDNPNEVYIAGDRPYGLIEAEIRRDSTDSGSAAADGAAAAWHAVPGFV